jgi:putative PIN family toxin of toxin-antitoxin system
VSASKIKAVIDTQIFLRAAINRKSLPAKVLFELGDKYQFVTSLEITAEVKDVLNRPKLRQLFKSLTDEVVNELLDLLSTAVTSAPIEIESIVRDPKDDMFLACAKAAEAHYIVSEDKDLLVLNPYEGIQIVNALQFLDILQKPPAEE